MKDSDEMVLLLGSIIIVCFAFAFGFAAGNIGTIDKSEIIKHNCAEYDSKTGNFKWIEGE